MSASTGPTFTRTILYPALQGPTERTVEADIEARWHQPLSEPRRFPRALAAAIVAGSFFWHPETPVSAEEVTVDKYARPFSEPVRVKPALRTAAQQAFAFVKADPFPESVTEDRWHQPFSEPRRFPRALPVTEHSFTWPDTQPIVSFAWFAALTEPVRQKLSLKAPNQQALAYQSPPVTIDWWQPLSEPKRFPRALPVTGQQFRAAFHPNPVISIAWFVPFSEPQRFHPALSVTEQLTVSFYPFPVRTQTSGDHRPLLSRTTYGSRSTIWRGRSA